MSGERERVVDKTELERPDRDDNHKIRNVEVIETVCYRCLKEL